MSVTIRYDILHKQIEIYPYNDCMEYYDILFQIIRIYFPMKSCVHPRKAKTIMTHKKCLPYVKNNECPDVNAILYNRNGCQYV